MKINREQLTNLTKRSYLTYLKLFPVLKKEKTKQYGMLILTFGTMMFFGIFAINPTLTTIVELHRKLDDARLAERELSKKITNLAILQNKFALLTADYDRIIAALPQNPHPTRLIGQMQAIAKKTGVALQVLNVKSIEIASLEKSKSAFAFSLQVSGTYDQIMGFLATLTKFDRIVITDSLAIKKASVFEKQITITVEATSHYSR